MLQRLTYQKILIARLSKDKILFLIAKHAHPAKERQTEAAITLTCPTKKILWHVLFLYSMHRVLILDPGGLFVWSLNQGIEKDWGGLNPLQVKIPLNPLRSPLILLIWKTNEQSLEKMLQRIAPASQLTLFFAPSKPPRWSCCFVMSRGLNIFYIIFCINIKCLLFLRFDRKKNSLGYWYF
jgi:hypothetical protein